MLAESKQNVADLSQKFQLWVELVVHSNIRGPKDFRDFFGSL